MAAVLGDAPRTAAGKQEGHAAAGMESAGRRTSPGLREARRPSVRKQEGRGIQQKEAGMGRRDAGGRGRRWWWEGARRPGRWTGSGERCPGSIWIVGVVVASNQGGWVR